jgi:hypothetical protein
MQRVWERYCTMKEAQQKRLHSVNLHEMGILANTIIYLKKKSITMHSNMNLKFDW